MGAKQHLPDMPRKAFVADLNEALESVGGKNFSDLRQGDDDGTFTFKHKLPGGDSPEVTVQALIPGTKARFKPRAHLNFSTEVSLLMLNRCI